MARDTDDESTRLLVDSVTEVEMGQSNLEMQDAMPSEQAWFYHPEVQARVKQAEVDFSQGRSTRTETPEEAQAFLNGLKLSLPTTPTDGSRSSASRDEGSTLQTAARPKTSSSSGGRRSSRSQ